MLVQMSYSRRSRSSSRDVENPGNNLYVTGLSPRITKKELEKHFAAEGTVIDVHLVVDPLTRESRGFGFVTMSTVEEADRCIKYLDRSVLGGRVITVEKVESSLVVFLISDPGLLHSASVAAGQLCVAALHQTPINKQFKHINKSQTVRVAKRRRGRTPTPGRYLGLRTIRGGGVLRLDDLLATLLIGGAGAGLLVIHLNIAGAGPAPLATTDGGHILLTIIAVDGPTPVLDPHTVALLYVGLREAQGGAIQEAFPRDQEGAQGGAIRAVFPQDQGGAIRAACPLHQGGAQGEVILEVFHQDQGSTQGGVDILETATLGAAVQVLLPDLFQDLSPQARVLHLIESKLRCCDDFMYPIYFTTAGVLKIHSELALMSCHSSSEKQLEVIR
ncbi:hypothetical protein POTOM_001924 [Populus tomentosa]|uniref:RRM domain-containing protein n=1 Tax=Populus tomentosa TaxID=118781 RepID=A0A8X8IW61_POPTO|nr:hypothetical protein POTOM_001924 [Populus tomentosa]